MKKRKIAILGSTGSIGTQALDVIGQHPDLFEVELLTANSQVDLLASQAVRFGANHAVICREDRYDALASALDGTDTKAFAGMDSVCSLLEGENIDLVLTAMVGFSGLRPTLTAIRSGKVIALANKETLVAGGALVMEASRRYHAPVIPVDSEHSAIFQCLLGAPAESVSKIHLTASGGPFLTWPKERIAQARPADALKHPKWSMGAKVTIDSASLMNKGLEMIEAKWLFDRRPEDIHVLVHPESIIHSMVEFRDGAVIAQLGCPDMRLPIQFALAFPDRPALDVPRLDFAQLGRLTFQEPDRDRFPALDIAFTAIRRGGNIPCAMNAANEAAVAAFLAGRIGFYDITNIVAACMDGADFVAEPSFDDLQATHAEIRSRAEEMIGKL